MKKLFLISISFIMFIFAGCSKTENNIPVAEQQASASGINLKIASEIQNIENINELDDETIKALSVVIRTNLYNKEEDFSQYEYSSVNNHILELINQTDDEVLINENNNDLKEEILIENKNNENTWQKEIKKADILKYLKNNNIKLSNISDIKTEKHEDGRTNTIVIGGKKIYLKDIMKDFDIPSNNIYNIKNNISSIIIEGKGIGNEHNFVVSEAENQAKSGNSYKKILKNRYNNFQIITKNKK